MALNCRNIVVSAFKISEPVFKEYFEELKNRLESSHPAVLTDNRVKIVP